MKKRKIINYGWVGSGEIKKYLRCDNKINIYNKEKYYSELTFHYWYWKNILPNENDNQWIGFCQKRRYWINCENPTVVDKENINQHLYEYAPENWEQFDVILCKPLSVSGVKKSKILKRGFKIFLENLQYCLMKINKIYFYILTCIMVMEIYKKQLM